MTIAEVVNKYGLSADTLRYYERVGIIPPVPRKNGIRNYDDESVAAGSSLCAVCAQRG